MNWSRTTIAGPKKNVKPTNSTRNILLVSSTLISIVIKQGKSLKMLTMKSKSSHRAFPKKNQKLICIVKKINCKYIFIFQATKDFHTHLVSKPSQVILILFNGLLVKLKRLQEPFLQCFPVVFFILQKPIRLLLDL